MVQDPISAQSGAIGPCASNAIGVPASSPASLHGPQIHTTALSPTLSLGPSPFVPRWTPWMDPGPGSSLPQSGAVDGACYQHPALPTFGPHGKAPHGSGHSLHWGDCQPQGPCPTKEKGAMKH